MRRCLTFLFVAGALACINAQDTNSVMNIVHQDQDASVLVDGVSYAAVDADSLYVYNSNGTVTAVARAGIEKIYFGASAVASSKRPLDRVSTRSDLMRLRRSPLAITIDVLLPSSGNLDIGVYDCRGGLVRQLTSDQSVAAGPRQVVWDGANGRGAPVAGGIYMIRCSIDGNVATTQSIAVE